MVTLYEALVGATVVTIEDHRDNPSNGWLILHLDNGKQVHIFPEPGTGAVIVDAQPH